MSPYNKTCRYVGLILNNTVTTLNLQPHLRHFPKFTLNTRRSIYTEKSLWSNIAFNLTDIGEGIREVVLKEWFVKVGDKVSQFDNICEVQSDKASVTITSRYDGVITKLHYDIDATALVGQPLVDIETEESTSNEVTKESPKTESSNETLSLNQTASESYKKALCIPSVRRLAKEHNINLEFIKGTGKEGRILKEDVLQYLKNQEPLQSVDKPVQSSSIISTEKIVPIRGFSKAMIKSMSEALKIPHLVYCDEIEITKLSTIRKSLKEEGLKQGIKLTILPFFIKATSNALKQYPILNSSLDENCENIIYKSSHNIGVAMDTAAGLAVPVIKNVEQLSILEIAKKLNELIKSGKKGSFTKEDLVGGTITISNIGAIGGTYVSPVIVSPQVAIIALGSIKVLPKFDNLNNIVKEEIINLSGSADHRIIDGATMAHFVNSMKKQLENPYLLLLHT